VNSQTASALGGTLSYTGNSQNAVNAGTYTITPQGYTSNNYSISYVNGSLTVNKATLTVTADNQTKTYGDSNPTLSYTITGYVNNETSSTHTGAPTISTTATQSSNVGTYTITSAANNLTSTNYQFSYVDGSLTITRLASITWIGGSLLGNWSDASNWVSDTNPSVNVVPVLNNVGTVNIPNGSNISMDDSRLVGSNTNVVNNGTISFVKSTDYSFDSNVSGVGTLNQNGSGLLTLSGNNNTFSGAIYINNKSLRLAHTNALGGATINSNNGSLSATTNLASTLNVTGAIKLASDISTTGNQNYAGAVTLTGGEAYTYTTRIFSVDSNNQIIGENETIGINRQSLTSLTGDITFASTLRASSSYNDKQSLFLKATNVYFNGAVGTVPAVNADNEFIYTSVRNNVNNFYLLKVNADTTHINADITTNGGQQYNGLNETDSISTKNAKVIVGGEAEIVTLLSVDPFININGLIDDKTKGFHILVTKAVSLVYNQAPIIYAATGVGTVTPFKNWLPESGYQVADPSLITSNLPSIGAGGNVRTMSASLTATVRYANSSSYSQYKDPASNSDWGKVFSSIVTNQGFAKLIQDMFSNLNMGTGAVSVRVINLESNSKNIDIKEQQIKPNSKANDDISNKDKKTEGNKSCDDQKGINCKN
jgi:autotransporter-associated beta strand protein